MFNTMLVVFIGIIGLIALINVALSIKGYVGRDKSKETVVLVRHRAKLTAKLILLLLVLIPFYRFNMNYGTEKLQPVAEKIVNDMYTEKPENVGEKLSKYRDKFTLKGYTYIDGKDNAENIIKRYNKYSNPNNKVLIKDVTSTMDKIYVVFSIVNEDNDTAERIMIFTKDMNGKFNEVEEFELLPTMEVDK